MERDFYKTPEAALKADSQENIEVLLGIAQRQRMMLTAFALLIGINSLIRNFMPEPHQWIGGILTIILLGALAVSVARLSILLNHMAVTLLLTITSVIPLLNLISLLVLIRQSSARLKAQGIRVGLFGAKDEDIKKLIEAV